MHFSGSADVLMMRIAKISLSVNQDRHWRRPEFYPVGLTGGTLLFVEMVVANAVSGNVVSAIVVVVVVVVVVGVVVTGIVIGEIVDVVTVMDFAVVLNDIVVKITASAICTDEC